MLIGLGVLFLVMLVVGVVGIVKDALKHRHNYSGWVAMTVLGALFFVVLGLIVVLTYVNNSITIKKLETFRDYNAQNYAVTVSETRAILSERGFSNAIIEGSLEKTNVGAEISRLLVEWRDQVNKYNITIASMRAIRNFQFLPGWIVMPEIPASLTPIVISK